MLRLIGLTGGIGSGKSTVAKVFETMGVPIFNADFVAKSFYQDKDVAQKVYLIVGENISNGRELIDKKRLASIVFSDKEKLRDLNSLIHPLVRNKIDEFADSQSKYGYGIVEAAILFDTGLNKKMHSVIFVDCSLKERIDRVMLRDKVSKPEVEARLVHQNVKYSKEASNYVINNSGTELILPQIIQVHERIQQI